MNSVAIESVEWKMTPLYQFSHFRETSAYSISRAMSCDAIALAVTDAWRTCVAVKMEMWSRQ